MRRAGFNLVEVLVAATVFFVMMMVFQSVFSAAHGGEGRDIRRTQALVMATELLEQVCAVHEVKSDLPEVGTATKDEPWPEAIAQGHPLYHCLGGQVFTSPEVPQFARYLSIRELRMGREDALLRPDRSYLVKVRVEYPGPFGERREVQLVTTRSRPVIQRPRLEELPWEK